MKQETIKVNDKTLKDVSKEIYNKDIIGQIKNYIEDNIDEYFIYRVKQENHKIFFVGDRMNAFTRNYKTIYEDGMPDFKRMSLWKMQ